MIATQQTAGWLITAPIYDFEFLGNKQALAAYGKIACGE